MDFISNGNGGCVPVWRSDSFGGECVPADQGKDRALRDLRGSYEYVSVGEGLLPTDEGEV